MSTARFLRDDEEAAGSTLSADDSWSLLASAAVGRLALEAADGVDIVPVNFVVTGREIFLRSAPGSKLATIAGSSTVAFEADGESAGNYWSVVVRGDAQRLSDDAEIEASGVLDLETMTSSVKSNFVRITARVISGRRYRVAVGGSRYE